MKPELGASTFDAKWEVKNAVRAIRHGDESRTFYDPVIDGVIQVYKTDKGIFLTIVGSATNPQKIEIGPHIDTLKSYLSM